MQVKFDRIGEAAGAEEATAFFPYPHPDSLNKKDFAQWRKEVKQCGRARAQGLYHLRGRHAKDFAQGWSVGYSTICDLSDPEDLFEEEEK